MTDVISDHDVRARQHVVIDAVNEHIKRYVVAVIPLDDETDHLGGDGGSGVAVQIGPRRFIAVANHVLVVPDERLTLLALDHSGWVAPGGIVRRVANSDLLVDVALLEIDGATAERLGCHFFPLARIRPWSGRLPVPAYVMLHGFPGALRERDAGGLGVRAGAQGFATVTVRTPMHHTPKPDLHLYCEYPETWTRAQGQVSAPSAVGYSGSGIWLLNYLDGKLWGPEHCELIAIQTDWQVTQRWIRGTEIQHVLKLIAAAYDDLRPLIERHIQDCAALTEAPPPAERGGDAQF